MITAEQVEMWDLEVKTLHGMLRERDAEIERLREALNVADEYAALCPPPPEAQGQLRIDLLEKRAQVRRAANEQLSTMC